MEMFARLSSLAKCIPASRSRSKSSGQSGKNEKPPTHSDTSQPYPPAEDASQGRSRFESWGLDEVRNCTLQLRRNQEKRHTHGEDDTLTRPARRSLTPIFRLPSIRSSRTSGGEAHVTKEDPVESHDQVSSEPEPSFCISDHVDAMCVAVLAMLEEEGATAESAKTAVNQWLVTAEIRNQNYSLQNLLIARVKETLLSAANDNVVVRHNALPELKAGTVGARFIMYEPNVENSTRCIMTVLLEAI